MEKQAGQAHKRAIDIAEKDTRKKFGESNTAKAKKIEALKRVGWETAAVYAGYTLAGHISKSPAFLGLRPLVTASYGAIQVANVLGTDYTKKKGFD